MLHIACTVTSCAVAGSTVVTMTSKVNGKTGNLTPDLKPLKILKPKLEWMITLT